MPSSYIAGVDEAGRGCIAGPVVAAAVILPTNFEIALLKDSKTLTEAKRNELYTLIKKKSISVSFSIINHQIIDKINILQASLLAMRYSIERCCPIPKRVLIDGNKVPNGLLIKAEAIVKGDQKVPEISAASIVAKVIRDKIMKKYHTYFLEYKFDLHKGYGTKEHYELIFKHGISPIHRKSFNLTRQLSLF